MSPGWHVTPSTPLMADQIIEFVQRCNAAIGAELDVAWDELHRSGWQPDQLEIRTFVDDPWRTQLAARDGCPALFEVTIEVHGFPDLHVAPRWLIARP